MSYLVLKKGAILIGLLAIAAIVVAAIWLQPPSIVKEVLFYRGTILTMEDGLAESEALLIKDGRIVGVGDLKSVRPLATEQVEYYDLGGQTLMPGFIEPHSHPLTTALFSQTIDVSGFTHNNRKEVVDTLRRGVAKGGVNGWVLATGWDPVMLDGMDTPTLAELDELSPDLPMIILTQMMHDAYANSLALEAAGIVDGIPNPQGGEFVRDANGRLTGTVREVSAINALMAALPAAPEGAAEFLLAMQWSRYAKAGYTTVAAMGVTANGQNPMRAVQDVSRMAHIPVRTVIYALPKQLEMDRKPDKSNVQAGVIGVKFWMDGSPFAGGAAFQDPYENSKLVLQGLHLGENHLAQLNYDEESFERAFSKYHQLGYQIAVHTQGERAIDLVLDTAEKVLRRNPRTDHRYRLEHNALITKKQLVRAHSLGFTPSFFIDHIYYYGHALPDIIGQQRTSRYMPLKTAINSGHRVTLHSDNPATPVDPFRVMRTARQREARSDKSLIGHNERLTPYEALRAMTIDAAWQLQLENETGSFLPGKSADLLLLSGNPLITPDSELHNIEVQETWLRGVPAEKREVNINAVALGWAAFRKAVF